jgi:hypothetical protein
MAQMTPTSTQNSSLSPSQLEEEAVRSVTLYFQSVGLPQENAARAAEEVVRSCQAKWAGQDSNLATRALDRAVDRLAEWFDRLASSAGSPSPGARSQLGWYLRPLIRAHPEIFLRSQDLPQDFCSAIEAACKPLLPLMSPRRMPPQSLWQLPHLWQRGIAYVYLMWYRLKTMRWLGRT